MIRDREDNEVKLSEKQNAHLLILGCSGSGKTYFVCRKLEQEVKRGKKIIVFDYSQSYTLPELRKAGFRYLDKVRTLNPLIIKMNWNFNGENLQSDLVTAVVKSLGIESYYQKKLLREAIKQVLETKGTFSIPCLIKQLEGNFEVKDDADERKNILHLLSRLEPYSDINGIQISERTDKARIDDKAKVEIIQLSDFSYIQRKFLVEFLSEIFWVEVRYGKKKADTVLFDEFQNVEVKQGSALSTMLREGRKFGLAVYLSSQFLGNYDKETVDTIMQAGSMIFFRPTAHDRKFVAKIIDVEHIRIWESILDKLQVGEAIIKGKYYLNSNTKEIENPIICKIQEVKKNEV